MRIRTVAPSLLLLAGGVVACGDAVEEEPAVAVDVAGEAPAAGAQDTLPAEMQRLRLHLRQMEGVHADSLRAMLPMHRQVLSGAMGHMRGMPMMSDPQWNALMDSLHQDMNATADVSNMSAEELEQWMAAHRARALRMMETYPGMRGHMR